jgi:hypothetical protein
VWAENALEGRKPKRGTAVESGQPGAARTDSQEEQGFEAGEVGGTDRVLRLGSGATGKRVFGLVERELIVGGGSRRARREARESRKPSVIRSESLRFATLVDDRKGASGPERGA